MIPIPKKILESLGETMDGKDIDKIIKVVAPVITDSVMFMKGDYDISGADIGIYEDIQKPVQDFMTATDFLESESGLDLLAKMIDASNKGESWSPGAGTISAAIIGSAYGAKVLTPAVQAEVARYSQGTADYMKQLADDLRDPRKGGLKWGKEWKERYPGTDKGQIKNVKSGFHKKQMEAIDKLARKAGREATTSVQKFSKALESINKSKFLSRTGKILSFPAKGPGPYVAPMVAKWGGGEIAEALGADREAGEFYGQAGGTALLTAKVGVPSAVEFAKSSAKIVNKVSNKTKMSFLSFLGRKIPAIAAKSGAMAMSDSPLIPIGDIIGLGLAAWEIRQTYIAWKKYTET